MSEKWWFGLPKELEKDIECEYKENIRGIQSLQTNNNQMHEL